MAQAAHQEVLGGHLERHDEGSHFDKTIFRSDHPTYRHMVFSLCNMQERML